MVHTLEALSTKITVVCHVRDIFMQKVKAKATSEMQLMLPNCSEEL